MAQLLHYRLKQLRESRDFSQGQVAAYSDVSPSLISLMEQGKRPNPSAEVLSAIAATLHTTTDYLLGLTANSRRPEDSTTPQTEVEWQLLEKFRELSFDEQRYIIAQLDLALDIFSRPAYRIIGGEDDDEAQETGSDKGLDKPLPSA